MLNPNNDRLDYGQILARPAGYCLDFAIGTTYSLDLDALVGASLALGLSEETDSELMHNPVYLLEALRSTGDRAALFCEGGQIAMPNHVTSLYILLEKMVFSVKTEKTSGIAAFPSFHPKFWLIRYRNNEGSLLYRVIILSRNLTFDRSWDVTYSMDGHVGEETSQKNEPVCDFLRYLLAQLPLDENGREKAKRIRTMIRELPSVVFEPKEKEFCDFEFIPTGIKKQGGEIYSFYEKPLFQNPFHEILIISPFISGDIIRDFNDRNTQPLPGDSRYMLITREISLSKLKPEEVSHFEIYTMRDAVIDGETAISEDAHDIQKQDIHAKLYMIRRDSKSDLFLGSLNASHNAMYGNVEFMIRLKSKKHYLNMDKLTAALFGEDNPFQKVTLQNAIIAKEDERINAMNAVIKDINRGNPRAYVKQEDAEHYSVSVHFGDYDTKEYQISIRPLLSTCTENFGVDVLFTKLGMTELSEFYALSVSDGEQTVGRVLIIPTEGLPKDREKKVVSSVVKDSDCFFRYVAFLLGDDKILSVLEANTAFSDNTRGANKKSDLAPALYEKMLLTAASAPEKFKGVDYLMTMISEDGIIPENYKKLYETFKKAVKING